MWREDRLYDLVDVFDMSKDVGGGDDLGFALFGLRQEGLGRFRRGRLERLSFFQLRKSFDGAGLGHLRP